MRAAKNSQGRGFFCKFRFRETREKERREGFVILFIVSKRKQRIERVTDRSYHRFPDARGKGGGGEAKERVGRDGERDKDRIDPIPKQKKM